MWCGYSLSLSQSCQRESSACSQHIRSLNVVLFSTSKGASSGHRVSVWGILLSLQPQKCPTAQPCVLGPVSSRFERAERPAIQLWWCPQCLQETRQPTHDHSRFRKLLCPASTRERTTAMRYRFCGCYCRYGFQKHQQRSHASFDQSLMASNEPTGRPYDISRAFSVSKKTGSPPMTILAFGSCCVQHPKNGNSAAMKAWWASQCSRKSRQHAHTWLFWLGSAHSGEKTAQPYDVDDNSSVPKRTGRAPMRSPVLGCCDLQHLKASGQHTHRLEVELKLLVETHLGALSTGL